MSFQASDGFLRYGADQALGTPRTVPDGLLLIFGPYSGSGPIPIRDSGTVVSIASFSTVETVADVGSASSIALLASNEALADQGAVASTAFFSALEALADASQVFTTALLSDTGSLVDAGVATTVALPSGSSSLADSGQLVSIAVLTGSQIASTVGDIISTASLSGLETVLDQGSVTSVAILVGFSPGDASQPTRVYLEERVLANAIDGGLELSSAVLMAIDRAHGVAGSAGLVVAVVKSHVLARAIAYTQKAPTSVREGLLAAGAAEGSFVATAGLEEASTNVQGGQATPSRAELTELTLASGSGSKEP